MKPRWLKVWAALLVVFFNLSSTVALAAYPDQISTHTIYLPRISNGSAPVLTGMVLIPAGTFQMGCIPAHNGGFGCGADETPLHPISLNAFRIDINLVTNAQYAQCVAGGVCTAPLHNGSFARSSYYSNPTFASYPVIWVDWADAVTYCTWAGKRLPTEAEWEKAARGSSATRAYPWGDQSPTCTLANYFGGDAGCVGDTSKVGSYPLGASPYGIMDMAGNVWQWVNDWYQPDYYLNSPGSNPPGPSDSGGKVLRGGDFETFSYFGELRTAHRYWKAPLYSGTGTGFRCAAGPGN